MRVSAHGLEIELPSGWSGQVFRRPAGNATLHAGDFPLPMEDGEFGARTTAKMPRQASFVAVVEYLPGAGLEPGRGLFKARRMPLPLDPAALSADALAHPRPGHAGTQHFFTASKRPLCLYVVLAGGRGTRRHQLAVLDRVLGSLRIAQRV